jgi:hypothetical protein
MARLDSRPAVGNWDPACEKHSWHNTAHWTSGDILTINHVEPCSDHDDVYVEGNETFWDDYCFKLVICSNYVGDRGKVKYNLAERKDIRVAI